MPYTFRPAVRENVNLLIGLAGSSGSGKTYTAMRLATGIAGTDRFCVIDTESGRASHYADQFKFDVCELRPPFSPAAYAEVIKAAAEKYHVIVVDSMSHEYAGDGGVLDMQEAEFQRMGGRDSAKMASWIKPKMEHKRMMQELLQVRAHLILCFRAEPKIDIIKEDGKTKIVPKVSLIGLDGWIPVTEKNVPFELTVSLLMTADAPGVPKPIKLQEQHRALFPLDKPITEESGRRIAEWAAGGVKKSAPPAGEVSPASASPSRDAAATPTGADLFISPDQVIALADRFKEHGIKPEKFLEKAGLRSIAMVTVDKYQAANDWVDRVIEARTKP
jgi:hypothetical protein